MKTATKIATILVVAGSLLISVPASARDGHYDKREGYHQRDYAGYKYDRSRDRNHYEHGDRNWRKHHGHKKHHGWKHDRRFKALRFGDRHRHHDHYRKKMIIIQADRHRAYHHHSSGLSTITGGVLGGIVGNHVGHGDPVATGIGIMTGAVIGDHIGRH